MKKINLILAIIFLITGCGGFEFVYKKNKNDSLINNSTKISVDGDDASLILVSFNNIVGTDKNKKYKLLINSSKKESAEVIDKDATVSKYRVEHFIDYNLYDIQKDCKIFKKTIKTKNLYNVKSAGYSFGTDMSKEEASLENINKNINDFISSLNGVPDLSACVS